MYNLYSYMFRHFIVIVREYYIGVSLSYTPDQCNSNIKNGDCIRSHRYIMIAREIVTSKDFISMQDNKIFLHFNPYPANVENRVSS